MSKSIKLVAMFGFVAAISACALRRKNMSSSIRNPFRQSRPTPVNTSNRLAKRAIRLASPQPTYRASAMTEGWAC